MISYKYIRREDSQIIKSANSQQFSSAYGRNVYNIWNLGLSVIAGIECNVYNPVSIFAEYEAVFSVGWRSDEYSSDNGRSTYLRTIDYTMYSYDLRGIRVGIGVRF